MNNVWYSADYDCWLWDWRFSLMGDPSTEMLSVCTSMAIGDYSDIFWVSPIYDELYNLSLETLDQGERMLITDAMQRMLYEEYACQCVAYRDDLFAVNNNAWTNYGDWESEPLLNPYMGLPWLYMRIYPVDNHAPLVQVFGSYQVEMEMPAMFVASAVDDYSALEFRWFWGDGTSTDWSPNSDATKTYWTAGVFEAYVAAREVGSTDGFVTWGSTTVIVYDPLNDAPVITGVEFSPVDPTASETITFVGHATDSENDALDYSWDFGDGSTGIGQTAYHTYMSLGTYTVIMYVTDNYLGLQTRPVWIQFLVVVAANSPPALAVPDFPDVQKNRPYVFIVVASDADPRDGLLFTWDWGDGTTSVTWVPYAEHEYAKKGTYVLTVTVSDQTGLPGHEVWDTGLVTVMNSVKGPHMFGLEAYDPV
jgi:PKD repeat protein